MFFFDVSSCCGSAGSNHCSGSVLPSRLKSSDVFLDSTVKPGVLVLSLNPVLVLTRQRRRTEQQRSNL